MENPEPTIQYINSRLLFYSDELSRIIKEYQKNLLKVYLPLFLITFPVIYLSPKITNSIGSYYTFLLIFLLLAIIFPSLYYFFFSLRLSKKSIELIDESIEEYTEKASSHLSVTKMEFSQREELENSLRQVETLRRTYIEKKTKLEKIAVLGFIFNSLVSLGLSIWANYIFEFLKSLPKG